MAKLFCAIVGVAGSAFPVDIDTGQTVGDLKKAIKEEKTNKLKDIDADALQLFLAKTADGKWLPSNDPDVVAMRSGAVSEKVQNLLNGQIDPAEEIADVFVPAPQKKEIHVLVVVPEGAVGSASETSKMDQVVQEVHEMYAQTVLTKRKRYVHSKVTSTQGRQLLRDLRIKVDTVRTVPFPVGMGGPVGGFGWESVMDGNGEEIVLTEAQQKERYRHYVEHNIGAVLEEKRLCVVGVENDQNVLTVDVPGHDIELSGRTDLLVLSDIIQDNPNDLQYLPDVKMLIEVKKKVVPSCDFQALSELIALDLIADDDPVVALLTDLNGSWLFFWVSENKNDSVRILKATIKNPGEAFERMKLKKALPSIGEGGESGGIRESIERYYDIASCLGPDLDMARAVARQVTRSIPTLSYFS
ncbi:hypothetical protein PF010_g25888 [Phytophthora fragariae]|uniref:Crinkler effector protein N-terminal domain-containing protein n=3 Tax=Phytophthora fragariae TaxID=53985 RepID=A0A6G0JYY2_9STRA|nr:hypothetical protein PF010_g25888 [Phytophthora fragariae]